MVEHLNSSAVAGLRVGAARIGVNDGADFGPGLEYVTMKPPFARRTAAAEPAAVEVQQRNVVGLEGVVRHTGGTDEEPPLIATQTDIAGGTVGQAETREFTAPGNQGGSLCLVRGGRGISHCLLVARDTDRADLCGW